MINPSNLTHEELVRLAEFQQDALGVVSDQVTAELIRRIHRLVGLTEKLEELTRPKKSDNLATKDEENQNV